MKKWFVLSSISEAIHFLYNNGPENFVVGITHAGAFHADDVLATSLLMYKYDSNKIHRNFVIVRANCTEEEIYEFRNEFVGMEEYIIAYDVGKIYDPINNIFDHHQEKSPHDIDDGHKLSSVGQLWRDIYGTSDDPIEKFMYQYVKKVLITPVDIQDNTGKNRNLFSDIVKDMNSQWDDDRENNDCFYNAVYFASTALKTEIRKAKSIWFARVHFIPDLKEMRPYDGGGAYIIDEDGVPPQEVFKMKKAAYLVQPSTYEKGKWQLMARPGIGIGYSISETDGCTFIHQNRFLATYKTKEQAVAAAEANLYGKLQERLAKENKGA